MTCTSTIWDPAKGGSIEAFVYAPSDAVIPEVDLEGLVADEPEASAPVMAEQPEMTSAPAHNHEHLHAEFEQRLAEETRRAFEMGRQQGQRAEQEAHAAQMQQFVNERRQQAEQLLAGFVAERDRYLAQVEQEVVRLSLQVAARVLRREAQMDPLLLTGAVRVALGQLAQSTTMTLRVPAADHELWQEAIAHLPKLQVRPEVMADASLHLGECVVEAGMGAVDLGVRAQLAEIERGFFDRAPGAQAKKTQMEAVESAHE